MALLPLLAAIALMQSAAQPEQDPAQPAQPAQEAPADATPDDDQATPDATQEPAQVVPSAPEPPYVDPAPPPPSAYYPQPGGLDRRIQLLPYGRDQIVTLPVSPGFASVVELADDERIENVIVGNSAGWQVTANKRGDRVIVKPLGGASASNMIVLTGLRRYVFTLDPFGETSYIMRFTYPQPVQTPATVIAAAQQSYKFRGNKGLFPLAMSDDGRRTVIRWNEQGVLPAVFAVNGRKEILVNGRMVGNDYVIEGAAPRYKFRYGKAEATATRVKPKRRR